MGIQHTSRETRLGLAAADRSLKLNGSQAIRGEYVDFDNEVFFKVSNAHRLNPFFMSLVSPSDHWVFIASNGALTAGRKNANLALFPYYSSDKIIDLSDTTGPTTVIQFESNSRLLNWEPFSSRGNQFELVRNVYKNNAGSKVILEEINSTANLLFSLQLGNG